MKVICLGGGLAALSFSLFSQNSNKVSGIKILEKDERVGGLARSYNVNGILADVGPHIVFSKNKQTLSLMMSLMGSNRVELRRSNRIIHKGEYVQYPFENDLSKLPDDDLEYCVNAFMNNPYESYKSENMLQFFLSTFGEGITNTYLRPYNEKIWKFDPAFMDMQMVERIPKPTKEEIMRSAEGETVDGYVHQLNFSYPKSGGIETIIDSIQANLSDKCTIEVNNEVTSVKKQGSGYLVSTTMGEYECDKVISTLPADQLASIYKGSTDEIKNISSNLCYNSIIIAIVNVAVDKTGDNFAFMVADKSVIFHRLSKLDFMGDSYSIEGTATYMVEITYRPGDLIESMSDEEICNKIAEGLVDIDFIDEASQMNFCDQKRFEYAYVVYDLDHRKNMDALKNFYNSEGVSLLGRFGEFEYLNMDGVIDHSRSLAVDLGFYSEDQEDALIASIQGS